MYSSSITYYYFGYRSVFERIHVNSNEVWKWEMYRLVSEYDQRPGLPPPIVVVELMYLAMKSIWKKACRRKKEDCKFRPFLMCYDLRYFRL